ITIDRDAPIVVGRGFMRTIGGIVYNPKRHFSTFDRFCHKTFRATRSDVMRNAKSDSDEEEEYEIKRNKFGAPIYGLKPVPNLNCYDPAERAVSFLSSLPVPLKQVNWKPNYKGCYTKDEEATGQWRTEIRLNDPYGNIYLQGFTTKKQTGSYQSTIRTHDDEAGSSRSKRSRKHETVEEVLLPQVHYEFLLWEGFNRDAKSRMGCNGEIDDILKIKVHKAGSNEEIFTSMTWIRAFNINEPIYAELCHDLTLLEFARRLGLYQAVELDEESFTVYFEGGLRSDGHFNAQEYWLRISQEENLGLSRSHTSTIRSPVLRVIHKMITYGWCQKTTGQTYANPMLVLLLILTGKREFQPERLARV
ncbi:hypothetical protein Tco_1278352, partial [Tanacetum coccineum]